MPIQIGNLDDNGDSKRCLKVRCEIDDLRMYPKVSNNIPLHSPTDFPHVFILGVPLLSNKGLFHKVPYHVPN
jgi:hypothetical protein